MHPSRLSFYFWHSRRLLAPAQPSALASPLLQLAAADSLLRLTLLLPKETPRPLGGSVLALALRLDEARRHEPLARVRLWGCFLRLLRCCEAESAPAEAKAALARERAALGGGGGGGGGGGVAPVLSAADARASIELLWHLMGAGTAGWPQLRQLTTHVWHSLWGWEARRKSTSTRLALRFGGGGGICHTLSLSPIAPCHTRHHVTPHKSSRPPDSTQQ